MLSLQGWLFNREASQDQRYLSWERKGR